MSHTIMMYFNYDHLPPHLQRISKPYCELAQWICANVPNGSERAVSLRKILEAKDAGVRAYVSGNAGNMGSHK